MPLSESENSRIHQLFEAAFMQLNERLHELVPDEDDRRFYTALLAGGKVAASAVVSRCEGVNKAWGDGNEEKALALIRLFTLSMLSQCYRWLDEVEHHRREELNTARKVAASNILQLFGDDSDNAITDFLNIDIQYNYDLKHKRHLIHIGSILLAKACEACGHKCIDWDRVSFPVKELESLTRAGVIIDPEPIRSAYDIKALWLSHAAGVQAMVKYHEEQAQV